MEVVPMTDDMFQDDDAASEDQSDSDDFGGFHDSDLGNLPPLSDFESSQGGDLDSGPSPFGASDSGGGNGLSGLPPISDIPVETPTPTGGNIKPPPPGFEDTSDGGISTPLSDSGIDTPISDSGGGFQDLSADSDFSPETPEIGPGPVSDIETPMFDSAFGSGDSELSPRPQTTAPTQAMETPMFGESSGPSSSGGGFDMDAFGSGGGVGGDFNGGTPVPDFSPDTAAPTQAAMSAISPDAGGEAAPPKPPKRAKGSKATGTLFWVAIVVIGVGIGILLGPTVSHNVKQMPMNPWKKDVDAAKQDAQAKEVRISDLEKQIELLKPEDGEESVDLTAEALEQRRAERDRLEQEIASNLETVETTRSQVDEIKEELSLKETEYVEMQQDYDELVSQASIITARRDGLLAEVDRLQDHVGELEVAETRAMETKAALAHAVDLLTIQITEGSPLAPEKYAHDARIAAVQALKSRVAASNWVDASLLDEYNSLYIAELAIANSREFFFAKIPVVDRFGTPSNMWSECLMNGNWSVYYRAIDGSHVGVYEDTAPGETVRYEFREAASEEEKLHIEQTIAEFRPANYEQNLEVLAQKQSVGISKTPLQQTYDSL